MPSLSRQQIDAFIEHGFVRLDAAFPAALAEQCRTLLWRDTGCDPDDPASWTRPVIRLGYYTAPPFCAAANTPRLHSAYDQLVGRGRWLRCGGLGTFPVRFPAAADPGDDGWHVDAGFPGPDSKPDDYLSWRVNIESRGRALLMLFLLSDIGDDDAPTRILSGSHHAVAQRLAPAGPAGLPWLETAVATPGPTALATGPAGTVYLCHPFLVHAAQRHRGTTPRFLAQPPLLPVSALRLERSDGDYSPVETAIRAALV